MEERRLAALDLSVLRLRPPASLAPLQAVALLRRDLPGLPADVNSLYQPYRTQGSRISSDTASLPPRDYARRMIAWPQGAGCGAGLRIGMIDTAVAPDLLGLAGGWLHQRSFAADGAGAAGDHGTAIADLLAARTGEAADWRGLLPAADLYAADVFGSWEQRPSASAVAIAAALDWMVESRVPVVNISVSGEANALLALAVRRAVARGTVLVAAAGNGGPAAAPLYPAAYPEVIAVTAVDQHGLVFSGANQGDYIAFAAPGVRIWVPGRTPVGRFETGTSFAAPFVTAAAALALGPGEPGDSQLLLRRLAASSLHLGPPGRNPIYGYGLPKANGRCGDAATAAP